LTFAKVRINFVARQYHFLFHPEREFVFELLDLGKCISQQFSCPNDVLGSLLCPSLSVGSDESAEIATLIRSFPALFSDKLGTVKGMVCHLDLSDSIPVR
jgi:hypothetical protein